MVPWRAAPRSRAIWFEECVQVGRVRRLDREAGRTGKGVLYFFPIMEKERIGQHRAVDLEYVISITDHKVTIQD